MDKPQWSGGFQAGYNLGQNGQGWPKATDPITNNNRGGFYIRQLRVKGELPFDSTFSAVLVANVMFADVQEAYLSKRWGDWLLKAGKFHGAGLHSITAYDEFDMLTVRHPFYAYVWLVNKRMLGLRDMGLQVEKRSLGGRLEHKLFVHNANGENVFNDEPSFFAGPPTQVLGLDYELDWRVTPTSLMGGHMGARDDRSWDEFIGPKDFWRADYWFKTNPLADFSVFHQMDYPRFHMVNEAMLLYNRRVLVPPDSTSLKSWGVSTLLRYDWKPRWTPFFRYEFTDRTDGLVPDDALHIVTLGSVFRPAPAAYPNMKFTGEYVRTLEEGGRNIAGNDILYVQMQMTF